MTPKGRTINGQEELPRRFKENIIALLSFVIVAMDLKDHYNSILNSSILSSTKNRIKAKTFDRNITHLNNFLHTKVSGIKFC